MITTSRVLDLLVPNRLDIGSKLLYIESIFSNPDSLLWSEKIYLEFIESLTLGTFQEPGSEKKGTVDYLNSFRSLINEFEKNGFDSRFPIPINNGVIVNGAHRLSLGIFLGLDDIPIRQESGVDPPVYDYEFFHRRGCSQKSLLESALAIAKYNSHIRLAIVWPRGFPSLKEILKTVGPNYFRHDHQFSLVGLRNLVSMVYRGEPWVGHEGNQFKGAMNKAIDCFAPYPATFIVYDERFSAPDFKTAARSHMNVGKSGIHTTDSAAETIQIIKHVLPIHNLNILEKIPESFTESYLKFKKDINEFSKNNKEIEYIVDGSQLLNLFGLRSSNDIDLIVNRLDYPFKLKENSDIHFRENSSHYIKEFSQREHCEDYFRFQDNWFFSPSKLIALKKERLDAHGDIKDRKDIEKLLSLDLFEKSTVLKNRPVFFAILRVKKRIRRSMIQLAKRMGLVDIVRKLKAR